MTSTLALQHVAGNRAVSAMLGHARGLPVAGVVPHAVRSIIEGAGRPLDADSRARLESVFKEDLSGVRVHDDDAASESAFNVGARAYAVGDHIVSRRAPAPTMASDAQLLAHEIAHVIQQRRGSAATPVSSPRAAEADAVLTGRRVAGGKTAELRSAAPVGLQRAPEDEAEHIERTFVVQPHAVKMEGHAIQELDAPQVLRPGDVYQTGGRTYVIYANEVRTGGVWAWVNNNPGNIIAGSEAVSYGAFPGKSNGHFAIFPDDATGFAAVKSFLLARSTRSILGMMNLYAPRDDGVTPMLKGNNPDLYAASIVRDMNRAAAPVVPGPGTGARPPAAAPAAPVTVNTLVSDLTADQLEQFATAIRHVEGGDRGVGTVIPLNDPALPNAIRIRVERAGYSAPPAASP